jgi:hypothetical protein
MSDNELEEVKRQRDSLTQRIQLMRDGKMHTCMGSPCEIDTTAMSIEQAEQSLAALERKIAWLEKRNT